jgi:predicted transcriptional regulator
MNIVKEEAKKLIDKLPDNATWDDIMYELYVKKKIAAGLKAAEEGRVVSHEMRKKGCSRNEARMDRALSSGFGKPTRVYRKGF